MYTDFYDLKAKPFEITPDPYFLYLSESHREALAHLTYAVKERRGFTVITGEVGTGKTTLIQTLLSRLDGNTRTAYVFNPNLGCTDFLDYICQDFGLRGQKRSKGQSISHLHNFLLDCYAKNENVVLIIDEAQNLDPELLEEVRLLTNLETPKRKLLQVILMGQPELNKTLDDTRFRQLKQRISLRYHVRHLNREEMKKYITYRLIKAGAKDTRIFTPKALDRIYAYSGGIPRLVNIVCDNALLDGYAADQKMIGDRIIRDVIHRLNGGESQKGKRSYARIILWAMMVCLLIVLLAWGFEFIRNMDPGWSWWIQHVQEFLKRMNSEVLRLF
jgi:general secretion pathway protein A